MSSVNYKPKPPISVIDELQFSDRLQRKKRALENAGFSYTAIEHMDRRELTTIRYKLKFPDNVTKNIGSIYRLLLPRPNMFELDSETGKLDAQHKVKQVLVYSINEYVDNETITEGPISYNCHMGVYPKPIVKYKGHDDLGNPIEPKIRGYKNIFYIEYKPETIDKILNEMDNQPHAMCVGIAQDTGDFQVTPPYRVHNLEEFRDVQDIESLIEANPYLKNEKGGYEEFLQVKEQKKGKALSNRVRTITNTTKPTPE